MLDESKRNYLLAIKRNNNDYITLEWHLTSMYKGENLNTLEGIDSFTSKTTRVDLIDEILKENMADRNDRFESFAIIYYEKGKNREVKEGTIFKEDLFYNEDEFIALILTIIDNKKALNKIYNLCNLKDTNSKLEEFKYILKVIDAFKIKGNKAVLAALLQFKKIPYETKRIILLKASKKFPKVVY